MKKLIFIFLLIPKIVNAQNENISYNFDYLITYNEEVSFKEDTLNNYKNKIGYLLNSGNSNYYGLVIFDVDSSDIEISIRDFITQENLVFFPFKKSAEAKLVVKSDFIVNINDSLKRDYFIFNNKDSLINGYKCQKIDLDSEGNQKMTFWSTFDVKEFPKNSFLAVGFQNKRPAGFLGLPVKINLKSNTSESNILIEKFTKIAFEINPKDYKYFDFEDSTSISEIEDVKVQNQDSINTIFSWIKLFESNWNTKIKPEAIELMDEIYLWDGDSGFLFGMDGDDEEFFTMAEEFTQNNTISFFNILFKRFKNSGLNFNDFYVNNKEKIFEIEKKKSKNKQYGYYSNLDHIICNYAIGQLMLEGRIEPKLKELSLISLYRLNLPEFLNQNYKNNILNKLKTIIEKAPE